MVSPGISCISLCIAKAQNVELLVVYIKIQMCTLGQGVGGLMVGGAHGGGQ